jgi:hypothetical protein
MIDTREDLWPSDFPEPSDPAPVALLKQQAALLRGKTNGEIEGVVRMIIENERAYHIFYLKASSVGDLMVAVLSISYPAFKDPQDVYPITADPSAAGDRQDPPVPIANDEEFKEWLRRQFSSRHLMSKIGVLKSYIRDTLEARASWAS